MPILVPIQGAGFDSDSVQRMYSAQSSITIQKAVVEKGPALASIDIENDVLNGTALGSAEIVAGDEFLIMVDAIATALAATNLR